MGITFRLYLASMQTNLARTSSSPFGLPSGLFHLSSLVVVLARIITPSWERS